MAMLNNQRVYINSMDVTSLKLWGWEKKQLNTLHHAEPPWYNEDRRRLRGRRRIGKQACAQLWIRKWQQFGITLNQIFEHKQQYETWRLLGLFTPTPALRS